MVSLLPSRRLALALLLIFAAPSAIAHDGHAFYTELTPFGNTSTTTGMVGVFALNSDGDIGYTGVLQNVQPMLTDASCSAPNGCGVHIHEGKSCESVETQMGHYYQDPPISSDPWAYERYYSNAEGVGSFGNVVNIGTTDVEGRAFIVHDSNGTRIACGLLQPFSGDVYSATTEPIGTSGVMGYVDSFIPMGSSYVFVSGYASGLEPNLMSPPNGTDCTDPNGCGVHIHTGTSCFNTTTQGGHLYNNSTVASDPWALVYYNLTDANGKTSFAKSVNQGVEDIDGRAFIIHSNNGSRVSCGLLQVDHESPTSRAITSGKAKILVLFSAAVLSWLVGML